MGYLGAMFTRMIDLRLRFTALADLCNQHVLYATERLSHRCVGLSAMDCMVCELFQWGIKLKGPVYDSKFILEPELATGNL